MSTPGPASLRIAFVTAVLGPIALNYVVLQLQPAWPGPARSSVSDDATVLGWLILSTSAIGCVLGILLGHTADQLRGRGRSTRKKGAGPVSPPLHSWPALRLLLAALLMPLLFLRLTQASTDGDGASITASILLVLTVWAPPATMALGVNLVSSGLLTRSRRSYAVYAGGLLVLIGGLSYGLNRAMILLPMVSLLAVVAALGHRVGRRSVLAFGFALLAIIGLATAARSNEAGVPNTGPENLGHYVQIYAAAPHFVGAAGLEISSVYSSSNLIASVLSPIPVVGESTRANSGTRLLNQTLYGDARADQLLYAPTEIWLAGGLLALLLTFFLLTLLARPIASHMAKISGPGELFGFILALCWVSTAQVSSLLSISQGLIAVAFPAAVFGRLMDGLSGTKVRLEEQAPEPLSHDRPAQRIY